MTYLVSINVETRKSSFEVALSTLATRATLTRASRDCGSREVDRVKPRRRHHGDLRPASLPADRRARSDASPAPRCRRSGRVAPMTCLARSQVRALSTDRRALFTDLVQLIYRFSSCSSCNRELWSRALTSEHDPDCVKMKRQAKYLGQRSFSSKVNVWTHT